MGFKVLKDIGQWPELYPHVKRELATVNKKSKTVVGGFELRHKVDYIPQPGLQENVCASECNLIFMCGQATSGKSFAMFFKALGGIDKRDFKARLINVRAIDSQKGSSMFADGTKLYGTYAGCQSSSSGVPTFYWPQWNSGLQLIHSNFNYANPDEKKLFEDYAKKQQASLIMIDEATEMNHFGMFAFWFMRNRDDSGMIPQMILSFNPLHAHWTTQMLKDAGYLDENGYYLRKEMIGKVRYFYVKGDTPESIVWGDTREEVVAIAKPKLSQEDIEAGITINDLVKSFTVFTGTAADNRELVNATSGQSVANLHAVGGTQRAVVGEAYFGPIEKEEINVNRQMIHQLWDNPINDDDNMYATMDISGGSIESDNAPMIIWKGLRIIAIEFFRGNPKELVSWIDRTLKRYGVNISNFAFDATGIGYYLKAYTSGRPITANKRCLQEYDEHGNQVMLDEYFNLRSQLLGKLEVVLKRGDISCGLGKDLIIPYGKNNQRRNFIDVLFDEMNIFITTTKNKKTYYRSKDEYKTKFHSSPDIMDAISYRMVFELDTRERKQPKPVITDDAYDDLYKRPPKGIYGRGNRRIYR